MRLTIDMPWERDLSVNHCRMGPQGNWHLKPHVEGWMQRLGWELPRRVGQWRSGEWWVQESRENALDNYSYNESWHRVTLPLFVKIDFRFPDKRRRDDHNYYKVICDAVAAGLGIDDKDIRISTGSVTVDRDNPGFTIGVTDEEN